MAWHYIFAKPNPRLLKYQLLTAHTHAATVEDQRESAVGVATIRRAELAGGETSMTAANDLAVRRALETAGVEFIDENGGGPGMRLRWNRQKHRAPPGS